MSLLRKSKRGYYENLNTKSVTDNKLFWKSVKPLLSDKSRIRDRINISEKGEILKTESETAETLNSFFSNIVKNLNISRYSEFNPVTENTADPTLKAIFKYKDHPSIRAIQSNCEKETFHFSEVNMEDIKKDILRLDKNKASQRSDIPIKIVKETWIFLFGALLTDLSKAFNCLDHKLLIAKLNAYSFSLPALKLFHDYLSNRKQRTKVNRTYSSWLEIDFGVPQGSILGPLLFNIFLVDLLFILNDVDIASYADDNTPYVIADDINGVITSLEKASKVLFEWFENNLLKGNADKCHLLVSSSDALNLRVSEYDIKKVNVRNSWVSILTTN